MSGLNLKIILLFIFGIILVNTEFPAGVEKCQFGDNACITKQMNYVLKNYQNGEENIHLVDLNPIKFKNMNLKQGKNGPVPVNIELKVSEGTLSGFKDCSFTKTLGFGKDLKGPHTVYFSCPKQVMLGNYTIDGKVLVLPIRGNGAMNLTTISQNAAVRFDGKSVEKNGKIFLDIINVKSKLSVKRLYMSFTNLFNDKILSDGMNKFLNENWEIIWSDLDEAIETSLGEIHKTALKSVFDNNPYNELFLD